MDGLANAEPNAERYLMSKKAVVILVVLVVAVVYKMRKDAKRCTQTNRTIY